MISVQTEDFLLQHEYQKLIEQGATGAVVTFVGLVRDFSEKSGVRFYLQHYPGMTEQVLYKICESARQRWQLQSVTVIHRVGELLPGDQIVFVGVSSKHRNEAFEACQFIMDILKTEAPFWKKEGDHWVDAKDSDQQAAERWLQCDAKN